MTRTITRDELKARLDAGEPTVIIEALPQRHFDAGHLPGAINIPHDAVKERAASELPDRDAVIVVYCASTECRNSRIAAETLTAAGYRNVHEYIEGKKDWQEAGYPLESRATQGLAETDG